MDMAEDMEEDIEEDMEEDRLKIDDGSFLGNDRHKEITTKIDEEAVISGVDDDDDDDNVVVYENTWG